MENKTTESKNRKEERTEQRDIVRKYVRRVRYK
jgi:hypothetical protein